MMAKHMQTDWKRLAESRGLAPDEGVTAPIERLAAQFDPLRASIPLETEPAAFPVLPLPESQG